MAGETYTKNSLVAISSANSLGGRLLMYKLSTADLADTDTDTCAEIKALAGFFQDAGETGAIIDGDVILMIGDDGDFNIYKAIVNSTTKAVTFETEDVNAA